MGNPIFSTPNRGQRFKWYNWTGQECMWIWEKKHEFITSLDGLWEALRKSWKSSEPTGLRELFIILSRGHEEGNWYRTGYNYNHTKKMIILDTKARDYKKSIERLDWVLDTKCAVIGKQSTMWWCHDDRWCHVAQHLAELASPWKLIIFQLTSDYSFFLTQQI